MPKVYQLLGLEIDIGVLYMNIVSGRYNKKKISPVIKNKTCFISRQVRSTPHVKYTHNSLSDKYTNERYEGRAKKSDKFRLWDNLFDHDINWFYYDLCSAYGQNIS